MPVSSILKRFLQVLLIGFAAFGATNIYYVQEMIAALVLFAVLFSILVGVLLALFLLDRGAEAILVFLEFHLRDMLSHAHQWRTSSHQASVRS